MSFSPYLSKIIFLRLLVHTVKMYKVYSKMNEKNAMGTFIYMLFLVFSDKKFSVVRTDSNI